MSDYALAIVGIGAIGRVHVDTAVRLSSAKLVALCDEGDEQRAAAADASGARAYADYRQLAYEERLDGVVLCTPPVSHPEIASFFLERGIDVLCEKPLAISGGLARDMYACARRNGTLLMLASKFRYVDDVTTARRLLQEGAIGSVRHAEIVFVSNLDMRGRWNADPAISGGGVVIDNGSHAADLCRYVFGPVKSVAAVGYSRGELTAVEDSAYLYLGTEEGAGVTVDLSWSLDRAFPYYMRIFGDRARLSLGWREATLVGGPAGEPVSVGSGYKKADAFLALQSDFVNASSGRGRARIDASDALASVDVVEAAYASIRGGGRTPVEAAEEIAV